MNKTYRLENLDCAHCAAKMEEKAKKEKGVIAVQVNFLMQTMQLEAADADFAVVEARVIKVCRKVEPDCKIKG